MQQKHYSEEFKERALSKVFGGSSDPSVDSTADGLKMSKGTLRNWMKRSLLEQKAPRLDAKQSCDWTPAERMPALQESHGLEEAALWATEDA